MSHVLLSKTFLADISASVHMARNPGTEHEEHAASELLLWGVHPPWHHIKVRSWGPPVAPRAFICFAPCLTVSCHAGALKIEPYAMERASISCRALKPVSTRRSGREGAFHSREAPQKGLSLFPFHLLNWRASVSPGLCFSSCLL